MIFLTFDVTTGMWGTCISSVDLIKCCLNQKLLGGVISIKCYTYIRNRHRIAPVVDKETDALGYETYISLYLLNLSKLGILKAEGSQIFNKLIPNYEILPGIYLFL